MLYWSVFLATLEDCQSEFLNSCGIVIDNGMQCYSNCRVTVSQKSQEKSGRERENSGKLFRGSNELINPTWTQQGKICQRKSMKIVNYNQFKGWLSRLIVLTILLCPLAGMLHAQTTATATVPFSPTNMASLESYSDTQLKQLMDTLEATPLIWPTNLPYQGIGGTYWSLAHPEWPPLPCTFGTPVWNLTPSSTSSGSEMSASMMSADSTNSTGSSFYLLDDVDYPPIPGTNEDGGLPEFQFSYTLPPGTKLTPPIFTNGNVGTTIYDQDPTIPYDIYYTTNLAPVIQWALVSHGAVGLTNYVFGNNFNGSPTVFFIAGSGADTVGQGLSDGFIALVLHLNPFASSPDGMTIGWKYLHGLNPYLTYTNYVPPATTVTITKPSNQTVIY
jgi:hypothetical protein